MPPCSNPGAAATIATGLAIVAVPAIVAGPVLGALGFGAAGVAAGSAAAGIQSGIGSVAAGSLFATLQSAAAGGYGVAAVHGVIQVVGAAIGAGGVGALFRDQNDEDGGDDSGNSDEENVSEGEGPERGNSTGDGESKLPK
ncbi:hypothetical protein FLONG3_3721 [Fusarium longipes]|uniref:Interferon-induced 6-16 n=1 Tax=Fusarium longipes TaxID=694270 RepID=A0A395T1G0_9HYPO|nr:hypothetical protein FLONG3_3721 [Fusarium longipes]